MPTPCPRPWPKCSAWPASLDDRARHRVHLAPADPGAHGGQAPLPGRPAPARRSPSPARRAHRWRTCACSPSSSRRGRRPSRSSRAPRGDRHVARLGVRERAVLAAATIEGKLGACAPRRRMRSSSSIATSRSVRPTRPPSSTSASASSASRAAARMRGDLLLVLHLAQTLHHARARHELPAWPEQLAQTRVLLDRERRVVEAEPALPLADRPARARGCGLEQLAGGDLPLERRGHLFSRLGA